MRRTRHVAVLAAGAAILVALSGVRLWADDEKPVKESEVPKPVLDSVKKKYPTADMKGFDREEEKGKVSYEVKIAVKEKVGDKEKVRSIEVVVSPEGKILAEEEKITEADLPDAVKKGLADSKYAKWAIKKVERIVKEEKDDDPSFELLLVGDGKKFEVVFDKSGKIVEEEDKTPKGKKGEKKEHEEKEDD